MNQSEPSLVPEWLKGSTTATGPSARHQQPASSASVAPSYGGTPPSREDQTYQLRPRPQGPSYPNTQSGYNSREPTDREQHSSRYVPPGASSYQSAQRRTGGGSSNYGGNNSNYSSHSSYNSHHSYNSGYRGSSSVNQREGSEQDNGNSKFGASAYRSPSGYGSSYRNTSGPYRSSREDDRDHQQYGRKDERWERHDMSRRDHQGYGGDRRSDDSRGTPSERSQSERSIPAKGGSEPVRATDTPATAQKATFDRDFPTLSSKGGLYGQSVSSVSNLTGPGARVDPRQQSRFLSGTGTQGPKSSQQPGSEVGKWTSRLADAPPPGSSFLQNGNSGAAAIAAAAAAAAAAQQQVTTPKMADALQHVADSNQPSASDLARREELALRQSRQLIPMAPTLPGKARDKGHPSKNNPQTGSRESSTPQPTSATAAGATSIPGGTVLQARSRVAGKEAPAGQVTRRVEELAPGGSNAIGTVGSKRTAVLLDRHALPIAPTSSVVGSAGQTRNPATGTAAANTGSTSRAAATATPRQSEVTISVEERQRLEHVRQDRSDFFSNLKKKQEEKKKQTTGDDKQISTTLQEEAVPQANVVSDASEVDVGSQIASTEGQPSSVKGENRTIETSGLVKEVEVLKVTDPAPEAVEVTVDDLPSLDAAAASEEEARFLRSLGWDEGEDDEDGDDFGLTEEEIAAFKASSGLGAGLPKISKTTPINVQLPHARSLGHHVGSLGSESDQVSSSDSDSD
mmetsp:Transcript_16879/g.20328  ORF Transcript_16879/g.20328 Transcript_16879/m.20328 type:complete len:741 (-) Transcript_16879:508-2730(-)|eukprot:CAMPEP_0197848684 /NCGR_PEP_ID=MMETSP1438-20131217/9595_1 /TAXON_ID=1461541 /ORGANISM="Pterosperma sp., Strain CCMP1384" /LENGTH=740 /DNA_ID=CAMNT_0043461047 /DNA_START=636 /DNA_END=2858 /DNA_ORIENTATION=+